MALTEKLRYKVSTDKKGIFLDGAVKFKGLR